MVVGVLLDNERVLVEGRTIAVGARLEASSRAMPGLRIVIHGGVVTNSQGRLMRWPDGRVEWLDGFDSSAFDNSGETDIDVVTVWLKPAPGRPAADSVRLCEPLAYPNIPGEDLLENAHVIVQRFQFPTGQWEGVHGHQPNMLFVHVRGAHWAERTFTQPMRIAPSPSPDGSVGWMPTIDASTGHESCNVGDSEADLIWISLKG